MSALPPRPGGHVWIIPASAAYCGGPFPPFADSGSKTAEVVSKLLLSARDREIRDPAILRRIDPSQR